MVYVIVTIIVIVLAAIGIKMSKDQGYTIGKGMFKNSEYNLDDHKDKSSDASDFDYWNKNQLK